MKKREYIIIKKKLIDKGHYKCSCGGYPECICGNNLTLIIDEKILIELIYACKDLVETCPVIIQTQKEMFDKINNSLGKII